MRRFIIRLAAATCLLTVGVGAAEAAVCVSIDEARDTLSPQERAAALIVVSKQFEQAGEQVLPVGCPTQYSLSHVRLGDTIVVTLTGPNGSREATATGLDDLPALYNQMVRSILTRRPMTGSQRRRSHERHRNTSRGAAHSYRFDLVRAAGV